MNSTELIQLAEKYAEVCERKGYDRRSFKSGFTTGYGVGKINQSQPVQVKEFIEKIDYAFMILGDGWQMNDDLKRVHNEICETVKALHIGSEWVDRCCRNPKPNCFTGTCENCNGLGDDTLGPGKDNDSVYKPPIKE